MIESFIVKNLTTNDKVSFGQEPEFDFIYEDGGIDWGNVNATHNTYAYPNQVGVSVYSTKIDERDISIEAWIFYVPTESEKAELNRLQLQEYCYEKIRQKKKVLNEVFNPSNVIRISTGGYFVEGKPNATPKYGVKGSDNNKYFCKFYIELYCANPMFKKESEVIKAQSVDIGAFSFPFFIQPEGMIFGLRKDFLLLSVENEGNVEVGGIITINAKGEVKNPTIINSFTKERMKICKTMHSGDTIIINTKDGEQRGITGIIHGEEQNFLQYWSFDNDWIKFKKGITQIEYTSENQAEDLLNITIEINPEKYGLEDM